MANSSRRQGYTDRNGNMFMPMNVEGGMADDNFLTTPKIITLVVIAIVFVIIIFTLNDSARKTTWLTWVVYLGAWAFGSSLLLRYIVFEEKYYYRMYKELEKYEISSPAIVWEINSVTDTQDGAILRYSDGKIGAIVKLERDTITGKSADFEEVHYDAISDFYKEIVRRGYSFVQMNIMELAGKDTRLNNLSKLAHSSENPALRKLLELEVGHIKNITNSSLCESDYFLIYSERLDKIDSILEDINECVFKILDGAFVGYTVLNTKEIVDLVKEKYNVNYFNSTEASLLMFGINSNESLKPFQVSSIIWEDGNQQVLTNQEVNRIKFMTSDAIRKSQSTSSVSFKDTLYRENSNNKFGLDLDEMFGNDVEETNSKPKINLGKQDEESDILNDDDTLDFGVPEDDSDDFIIF